MSDADDSRFPEWLIAALGIFGVICFVLMLLPQAVLNARRQSTQGMSVGLMVLWHVGSVLATAYYAALPEPALFGAAGISAFCLFCGVVEAQAFAYRGCKPKAPSKTPDAQGQEDAGAASPQTAAPADGLQSSVSVWSLLPNEGSSRAARRRAFVAALLAVTASSALGDLVFFYIFRALPEEASYTLGNVVPSVLFAVGFLPQLREFVVTRDVSGYSFAVTAIDVAGCTANVIILFAPRSSSAAQAIMDSAPFLTIIVMHGALVLTALLVVCRRPKGAAVEAAV